MNRQLLKITTSAGVLMLLAGCVSVNIEPATKMELAVKPISSVQTKNPKPLEETTIGIFANHTASPAGTDASTAWSDSEFWRPDKGAGTLYIDNGCFAPFNGSYAGADPAQTTTHEPYFWPTEGSLMFSAYSPHQSQNQNITSVKYLNYAESTYQGRMEIGVVLQPGAEKNFDLLWADVKDINGNKTVGRQIEAVPLLLFHAQSRLTFNISNPERQYIISAKLMHCLNSGFFFSGQTPGWKPNFEDKAHLTTDFNLADNHDMSKGDFSTTINVLPMQLNGQYPSLGPNLDHEVILRLVVSSKDGVGHETRDFPMKDFTVEWTPKHHYIYNIKISSQKIEFAEPIIKNTDQTSGL